MLPHTHAATNEKSSFRNDILPVLSKAGCNSGGCHGALAGKGGFKLSLFGYNPEADYLAITRESRGRRIDLANPGASLFLTKPTTALKHKGGKRFDVDSEDYRLLAAWIAEGAPGPQPDDAQMTHLAVTPEENAVKLGQSLKLTVRANAAWLRSQNRSATTLSTFSRVFAKPSSRASRSSDTRREFAPVRT